MTYPLKICIPDNNWYISGFKIDHCEIYTGNECIKCIDGKYLEDNTCVDSCTGDKIVHLREIFIDEL